MEELLKIAYMNFLNDYDEKTSKEIKIINDSHKGIEVALARLNSILNEQLFNEVYDNITDSASAIQEAGFIAGFAYCAKFLTNGKTDLFPNI